MLESWNMKKLLAIIVLCLLWSNVGYSDDVIKFECDNPKFQIQEMVLDKRQKTLSTVSKYKDKFYNDVVKKRSGNTPQMSNPVFKVTYLDENILKYKAGGYKIEFNYNTDGKVLYNNKLLHTCNKVSFAAKPKKETKPSQDDNKIVAAASGTGFFVSRSGHIITNHHVIDGCNTVKLNFNGKNVEAKVLAIDKVNDLAIVKADINPSRVYSVANKDVQYMKLLKCLCSSATCAQTAQLTSQHVRQARTTREMRATALASAGGSAAVALPFGCCGRATNGGAG